MLRVDTRLVAVTNRELSVEAAAGRFREDLYHRLNVVRINVPPLRERRDDIVFLAEHFLNHFALQYQKGTLRFTPAARLLMQEQHWPGNVRELQNRIMQAVILTEGPEIGIRELDLDAVPPEQTQECDPPSIRPQPLHGLAALEVAAARTSLCRKRRKEPSTPSFRTITASCGLARETACIAMTGYETSSFVPDPVDPTSLSNRTVRAIYEDREHTLWVGTDSGLDRFDPRTEGFSHFTHDPSNPESLSHNSVRVL